MKKHIFSLLLLFLGFTVVHAQQAKQEQQESNTKQEKVDSIELRGVMVDSFTREALDSVWVEVYSMPDSVLVDTFYSYREHMVKWGDWDYPMDGFQGKVATHGKYMLYAIKKGYKQLEHRFEIPRKRYNKKVREWNLHDILMQKAAASFDRDLDELTVKATRVKMVMKGDTVVFNADAFQLSEGSMLDALVRQLPGVEIREGGEIYINGNKVDELLVNGKDFFNGDAKVALENLPAYVVQNIKAYQRESKYAYLDKHHEATKEKDPWVLDVNLKREYAQGWLGNVEAGYGWDSRYMARLFAIRYTDHSRITAFANANNTNDFSRPGDQTSWSNSSSPTSEVRTITGGIDLQVDDKVTKSNFYTSVNASRTETDSRTESSSQTFLPGGDVFRRSLDIHNSESASLRWSANGEIRLKEFFSHVGANINYSKGKNSGNNRSATFSQDPLDSHRGASLDSVFAPVGSPRLDAFLTNRSEDLTRGDNHSFSPGVNAMFYTVAPWNGEMIHGGFHESYSYSQGKTFSHYDLRQQGDVQDFRNRYTESPSKSNNFGADFDHTLISYKDLIGLSLEYSYSNSYNDGHRDLYDLHKLGEGWGAGTDYAIGQLPSTRDSLGTVRDRENSYYNVSHNQDHRLDFSAMGGGEGWFYYVSGSMDRKHERLEDTRGDGDPQILKGRFTLWNINGQAEYKRFRIGYSYSQSSPSLSQLLDVTDDSNPLSISKGNPDLKNTHYQNADINYSHNNTERQSSWSLGTNFNWRTAIGSATTYDRETGVYTYQPRNVSGNWGGNVNGHYYTPLDKQKHLTFSSNTNGGYNRSVDLSSDQPGLDPQLSYVHNYNVSEWMSMEYRLGEYSVSANANANYLHATSSRPGFMTINSVDFSYGLSSQLKFKHGYSLDMDLTMHSRRGYEDKTMNDDNLVLNAALSKAFFKSRCLVLRVTGHDILQQLDNVRRNINAQGRTEVWYNTQPSYVLCTLSYRLDMKPKKREQ